MVPNLKSGFTTRYQAEGALPNMAILNNNEKVSSMMVFWVSVCLYKFSVS